MAQVEDTRSVAVDIDPDFLADGPDTEPPSETPEQKEELVKLEERERVLKEFGDHFLILIPEGVKGIGFYMTRVSIDENGAPTVDRATIIAILEKITRDLKTMEEMDLQKQVAAQMVRNEQERQQRERAKPAARIVRPQ